MEIVGSNIFPEKSGKKLQDSWKGMWMSRVPNTNFGEALRSGDLWTL